ncbi:Ubiquitin-like-conjugating enzyme ATG10 [Argiope bruennichi]|uniref:Ubiquitin-like-conjugating enzyme ATG10 n=1 Tax=Argiope bruennichi TaxID=94029 RepID=A0A8T0G2D9_ARGBR|nr:Ubiquitin-like-conjugating enzyme ATG10 [Argiope bruennichi]
MTLEFENFKKLANDFASISLQLGDEWVIKTTKRNDIEDIYLEKRIIKSCDKECQDKNNSDEVEFPTFEYAVFIYHIIYSKSYYVPVLWFTAHHSNGKLLSLEELWKLIPNCFKNNDPDAKWNMLTQQEHPILGIPYFMIHPCYTSDLLSACCSKNYIITWLSVVGPVAGLNLPLEYAKHI